MRLQHLTLMSAIGLMLTSGIVVGQDRRGNWDRDRLPREIMQELYREADANKDGELDAGERQTMREQMKLKQEEREMKMLAEFDKDGDGELSRLERRAAREAERKANAEKRKQDYEKLFDEIDADDDGQISKEEWLAQREMVIEKVGDAKETADSHEREREMEKRYDGIVKRYDKDGDGELSREEREAARKDWRDRMRPQRDDRQRPELPDAEDGDEEL